MPKYWQTAEFKKLVSSWYEKLKESGFSDAERRTTEEYSILHQNAANCYRHANVVVRECKEDYYILLSHHMDYSPPRSRTERLVMHYASFGAKISEICEEMKAIGVPSHRQTVRFIIRKHEHYWGVRIWSQNKLNPKWRTTHIK